MCILVTKQVNDKERVTAALENPPLLDTVKGLVRQDNVYGRY